jgi:DNA-binding LacI/PurR family transcriptional regulator
VDLSQQVERSVGWAVGESVEPARLEIIRDQVQTAKVGEEVARTLLRQRASSLPDGVVAGNDLLALGLLHGLIMGVSGCPRSCRWSATTT